MSQKMKQKPNPELYYTEFADACAKVITDKDCKKYFKRYDQKELPRVIKILGFLKSVMPKSILDVGSGRGRLLWPMVYNLPDTEFTCIDKHKWRCDIINAVHDGGVDRVRAIESGMCPCELLDNSVEVTVASEVIEHVKDPKFVLDEIFRVTRDFIIITVPSKPDNNPDHIHFFKSEDFEKLINSAEKFTGKIARRVTFDYVPKHMVVTIRIRK
jgi:ubiquinone/menaquinone biosynthesis C-methylase UbiE